MLSNRRKSIALAGGGLALALGLVAAGVAWADNPADAARYPYDPACAWGRIANGHGMLVRCITRDEASQILSHSKPTAKPAPASAPSAPMPPDAGVPDGQPPVPTERVEAEVGPVTPDQGKLPKAVGKLRLARKRFEECVENNGGLGRDHGEVDVRFLVRGSRGLAEGVSVKKRRGVGSKAAQCVAGVVDRRSVGVPDAPLVGATLVVKFSRVSR